MVFIEQMNEAKEWMNELSIGMVGGRGSVYLEKWKKVVTEAGYARDLHFSHWVQVKRLSEENQQ